MPSAETDLPVCVTRLLGMRVRQANCAAHADDVTAATPDVQMPPLSGDGRRTEGTVERTRVACPASHHWRKHREGEEARGGEAPPGTEALPASCCH